MNKKSLDWHHLLKLEKKKSYFVNIINYIIYIRQKKMIFPPKGEVFNVFLYTKFSDIKVVILGQDPYCRKHQAHGLAFSVNKSVLIPPSLKNIQKELNNDFNTNYVFSHGCLKKWACQGVFLLNSILTVESGKPNSHRMLGWEIFTDFVISLISKYHTGIIFLLWGSYAKKKQHLIDKTKHYIFLASHPSPLSAYQGFFGCRHFSKTNKLLNSKNKIPIDWFI